MKKSITTPLTYTERTSVAQAILDKLRHNPNSVYSSDELSLYLEVETGHKAYGSTLRKVINYLRQHNFPITSTQKGYSFSTIENDIDKTIEQLEGRIASMQEAIKGLKQSKRIIAIDFI
jgi:hypothetical protein